MDVKMLVLFERSGLFSVLNREFQIGRGNVNWENKKIYIYEIERGEMIGF